MKTGSRIRRIVFAGNHLPRKCGIATFTSDVLAAVANAYPRSLCSAVSVNDIPAGYAYPEVVRYEIEQQELASYLRVADDLNNSDADVVCLQHEFGIYGGPAGGHILPFLRKLKMPVITTLHTVLSDPGPEHRRVMDGLISLSSRLVVMAERGRKMLREIYRVPASKIDLIPHGIPDTEFAEPACFKGQFGVEGKIVLLTFGLLSPNKGIEQVINALPGILNDFPDVVYIVLGATHPNELREKGETYRRSLEALAEKNGVASNLIFYNQFVDLPSLTEFIAAADIYITPYLNEAQITSGTLAYAFGTGKVVVSTPYWHATELLSQGCGVLVPFGSAVAITDEVNALLGDDTRRQAMRENAYKAGRSMIWSRVGEMYMQSFEQACQAREAEPRRYADLTPPAPNFAKLPAMNLSHLLRMTDSTGVFQHAVFNVPNFSEGYCTDDNARTFILAMLLSEEGDETQQVRGLATTSAAFLHHAFDRDAKRFHNHLSFDRRWLDVQGSEDSHGRALWALGTGAGRSRCESFQMLTRQLFEQALPAVTGFTSPRAWAFALIGINEYQHRHNGDERINRIREDLTGRLMKMFEATSVPEWQWFEDELAYDNAKLAQALIVTGQATGRHTVVDRGLQALRWLIKIQTSDSGVFQPIGSNGFHRRGGRRAEFDQQPVEAQATVSACLEAWRMTSDPCWHKQAQHAFDWFTGNNDLGLELYIPETGGCRDGLHIDRANGNQGAESTLAMLLSLTEMQQAQDSSLTVPLFATAAVALRSAYVA